MGFRGSQRIAMLLVLIFEAIIICLFGLFVEYGEVATPPASPPPAVVIENVEYNFTTPTPQMDVYLLFQDIHVMVFIGFGYLMSFLKKYAFSAIGFPFLFASVIIQYGILLHGFLIMDSTYKIHLNIYSILTAEVMSVPFLISFGVVIGKVTPLQLFIMSIVETTIFAVNDYMCSHILGAVDPGGSVFVHVFGAYFGLAASFVVSFRVVIDFETDLESSSYESDIHALIGTLFLWMFWPSFNAALLTGDAKVRCILNTYLALLSSCAVTFAVSLLINEEVRFTMAHVQNATLAGAVCVGSVCNLMINPFGTVLIGVIGGILTVIGSKYIQEFLTIKLKVHDTCGVHNLHGIPGLASGIIAIIMASLASRKVYGDNLETIYPAMGEPLNRSGPAQAIFQFAAFITTILVSITGGLVTGGILRCAVPLLPVYEFHDDELYWDAEFLI